MCALCDGNRLVQIDYHHDDLKWVQYLVFHVCLYVCMSSELLHYSQCLLFLH